VPSTMVPTWSKADVGRSKQGRISQMVPGEKYLRAGCTKGDKKREKGGRKKDAKGGTCTKLRGSTEEKYREQESARTDQAEKGGHWALPGVSGGSNDCGKIR